MESSYLLFPKLTYMIRGFSPHSSWDSFLSSVPLYLQLFQQEALPNKMDTFYIKYPNL